MKEKTIRKICPLCGKEYFTIHRDSKFCSRICSNKNRRRSDENGFFDRVCKNCGIRFKTKRSSNYCSTQCYSKLKFGVRDFPEPLPVQGARWVELGYGTFSLIDETDYELVSNVLWRLHKRGYAYRLVKGQNIYLHRFIMESHLGKIRETIDHINGDKLDNRKCNLRVATQSQNNANQKMQENTTSEYKGVCFNRNLKANCWRAYIRHNYKMINIGSFSSEEAAARAYDQKAKELFGTFAKLNFPES